ARLKAVNERLWVIEDDIRIKEKAQAFDDEFIALARSVYVENDERARIKKDINLALGSTYVEEKTYQDYGRGPAASRSNAATASSTVTRSIAPSPSTLAPQRSSDAGLPRNLRAASS